MDGDHDNVCSCASCPPPFFLCVLVPKVADMTRHTPVPEFLPACRHDTVLVTMATAASTGWCYRGWWWWGWLGWNTVKIKRRMREDMAPVFVVHSPIFSGMFISDNFDSHNSCRHDSQPLKATFPQRKTKHGFLLTFTMALPFLLIMHFFSFINCTTLFPFVIMACRTVMRWKESSGWSPRRRLSVCARQSCTGWEATPLQHY